MKKTLSQSSYSSGLSNENRLEKKLSKEFKENIKISTQERNFQNSLVKSIIKSATNLRICNICTNTIE